MLISFVTDKAYQNDAIFDFNDPTRYKYYSLRNKFLKYGYEMHTSDIVSPREADVVLFHDLVPGFEHRIDKSKQNYALLIESPLIRPESYKIKNHRWFNKVFTWSDKLLRLNSGIYVKINYSFHFPISVSTGLKGRDKLIAWIVSNKLSSGANELYSKRKEIIRWFENNHPEDFDLFGRGWDRFNFGEFKFLRVWCKIPPVRFLFDKFLTEKFPSYKGQVKNKRKVLECYKFALAFENVKDEAGYITEKIFDAFFAGCVPVYMGANNILDYIPDSCFVNFRNFSSLCDLYLFMCDMSDDEYLAYQNRIVEFLKSDAATKFKIESFVNEVSGNIIADFKIYNKITV